MSKIYKNLMGNDSKIHPEVIAIGDYVVEQGENSNGSYTKWASGKLECWTTIPYIESVVFTQAISTYTRSQIFTWNFPVTFSSTPAVVQNTSNFAGSTWTGVGVADNKTATYRYLSFLTPDNRSVEAFSMYAIGQWK